MKKAIKFMVLKAKYAPLLLVSLPFLACLALPAAILGGGGLKQAGKCAACRLISTLAKNENIRFC